MRDGSLSFRLRMQLFAMRSGAGSKSAATLIDKTRKETAEYGGQALELHQGWEKELYNGGWAGVAWPKEHGGRDASLFQQAIFTEEYVRARAPERINRLGLGLIGPTLMVFGTEQQKKDHLAKILSCDEIWCQGFSEPDAGSDFANVQTRAEKVDGGWSITGQKVWTSIAQESKWCMLVARTDAGRAEAQGPHVLHPRHARGRRRGAAAPPDDGAGRVQRDLLPGRVRAGRHGARRDHTAAGASR